MRATRHSPPDRCTRQASASPRTPACGRAALAPPRSPARSRGLAPPRASALDSLLSSLPFGPAKLQQRAAAKERLLAAIEGTARGAAATEADAEAVEQAAAALERLTPNFNSLAAPCINGRWELVRRWRGGKR